MLRMKVPICSSNTIFPGIDILGDVKVARSMTGICCPHTIKGRSNRVKMDFAMVERAVMRRKLGI